MSANTRFVEAMEPRRLLCASAPAPAEIPSRTFIAGSMAVHANVAHTTVQKVKLSLTGSVSGTYTVHQANPDAGATYGFKGIGNITPVGGVSVHGSIFSTGNTGDGRSTGTLKIAVHSGGTLTLDLTGPSQQGMTPVPDVFNFKITAGTGRYRKASGSGYIALTGTPSPTAAAVMAGTFGMSFLIFAPP
jgi:hypothetical protein